MKDTTSTRTTSPWAVGLLLAGLLVSAGSAQAQAIKVTSAVPDTADQGTIDLVVAIGGENFGKSSSPAFVVRRAAAPPETGTDHRSPA